MATAYEIITQKIIAKLETNGLFWRKTWRTNSVAPRNLFSKKAYSGINLVLLWGTSYSSPYWVTINQVKKHNARIALAEMKNSETVTAVFPVMKVNEETGQEEIDRFSFRYYQVWNVEQLEDWGTLPRPDTQPVNEFNPIEAAETLFNNWENKPGLRHGFDQPLYSVFEDCLEMPKPGDFVSSKEYYATLYHECVHATGHSTRLNRDSLINYATDVKTRAFEELVAELGACFLMGECGLEYAEEENAAAYLKGWLKALHDDPKFIVKAASAAGKAANFIKGETHEVIEETA